MRVLTAAISVVKIQIDPPAEGGQTTVLVYQHVNRKSLVPCQPETSYFVVSDGEERRIARAPEWDDALGGFEKAFWDESGNAYIASDSMGKIDRIFPSPSMGHSTCLDADSLDLR
ncbi:hypothetical protein ACN9MY_18215 [Pseudoduganella sp. R-31]|uniref:hypothetical protein n=1 Tax=unclassified Pseudoduganella TaxID=2637179 RepID=UPI003CF652BC